MGNKSNIKNKIDNTIANLNNQRKVQQSKYNNLRSKLIKLKENDISINSTKNKLTEIEKNYRAKNMLDKLSMNTTYVRLKKNMLNPNKKKVESEINKVQSELANARKKIDEIDSLIKKHKSKLDNSTGSKGEILQESNKNKTNNNNQPLHKSNSIKNKKTYRQPILQNINNPNLGINKTSKGTYIISWNNITFNDGFITIYIFGHNYNITIQESKFYFNSIRHYYNFHNIPKLEVKITGTKPTIIKNAEVLFYHIDFMSTMGSTFDVGGIYSYKAKRWKRYTKYFYKKHLPFILHTSSLKKLCEYSDDKSSIIPIGEVVINNSGSKIIHNSFLFSINSKNKSTLVWESVEPGKASYIFDVTVNKSKYIQRIFDYIVGNTTNKRHTLIHSKMLQDQLKFQTRVYHNTTFVEWDNSIKSVCNLI